jgi:SAM-dependent methyltransferase
MDQVIRTLFVGSMVVRCQHCGLGRLEPMPTHEQVLSIYRDGSYLASYDQSAEVAVIHEGMAADPFHERFQFLDEAFPDRTKRRRLLDIGASRGVFLHQACQAGWDGIGIETEVPSIQYAKERFGIHLRNESIESASFDGESFEVIHASHVLEHLYDPVGSIERVHGWLRPGGVLLLEVPYEFGDLFSLVSRYLMGRPAPPNVVPSPHLYFFTIPTLSKLLERCGLEVVFARSFRRNPDRNSQILGGSLAKRWLYQIEERIQRGPLIEIYARKPD